VELLLGMGPVTRVSLDQDDFRTLIRGGVVEKADVHIALRDIGWVVMATEINDAMLASHRRREEPIDEDGLDHVDGMGRHV
jgi:hypothetical protein